MEKLILLHGALGSKEQLEELAYLLKEKYQVYTFNFSGHGDQPSIEPFSNDLFSENIYQFLSENKIEKCHLFGYSMGGYVALYFANKYPDKIGKIITLATKFNWTLETAAKEIKMLNPNIIEEKVPKFAAVLKARHVANDWKMVLNKTADMMLGLGNGNALKENDLKSIKNEVLIAVGDVDKMVAVDESSWAVENLPNGKLMVLNGVEHPIEKVDRQELSKMILNFIQ
ncbi:MAG: alpha/beta fold hydrolase [Saprospiraceae bacterium]